jgi:hypothetical protein
MTEEELDAKARLLAALIDATSIYDIVGMRENLRQSEILRKEFVKLYGLDDQ